ncbi:MAG: ferrous iron transport protein A [Clostridiales Family XIII bacterium]|nr:ferrous iron transport protein A [Clostridiales Family XIII bacterium]
MMPLTMTKPGYGAVVIRKISGKDEVRKRLEELGFLAGEKVTVVSAIAGNLILSVKGTRIALDRSLAQRILVE